MNITDIKEELKEARRLRDNTSVKINDYSKKGKDTSDLEKQLQGLRDRVAELTRLEKLEKEVHEAEMQKFLEAGRQRRPIQVVQIPESAIIPTKPKPAKIWKKSELEACERTMNKILEDNDWQVGYQFRSSEWMSIKDISTKVLQNSVELTYTIQYRTNSRRVEKVVTKYFNPETIQSLDKYIEQVELWVMLNSGDMDDKSIVFGARFNQVQFENQGFPEKGWVIKK